MSVLFLFKQKTAYEMRISYWSSDVCSSDLASTELAAEKGAFPLYDSQKYLAGETVGELDEDVRAAIAEHGIRNALLTSIAPTGTISLFADNRSAESRDGKECVSTCRSLWSPYS